MIWDFLAPNSEVSLEQTNMLKQSASSETPTDKPPMLNCIYEKNCSELYKAIEKKKWGDIATFLDTSTWPGITIIPDYSPSRQAITMVNCLDEDRKVIWSHLPVHLAILQGAPIGIIGRLLDLAPRTAEIPDHNGNLALHLGMLVNARDAVLGYILTNYPAASTVSNKAGLTALECAMRAKNTAARTRGKMIQTFHLNTSGPPRRVKKIERADMWCDYGANCSPLYKQIQKREWNMLSLFLTTGDWHEPSWMAEMVGWIDEPKTDVIKEQVMTSVKSFDGHGKLKFDRLPIHIIFLCDPPLRIVQELVKCYPESVGIPDHQGMLPIHLALYYNVTDDIIAFLLEIFPESANIRGMNGLTPIEIAQEGEHSVRGDILHTFTSSMKTSKVSKHKPKKPQSQ